MNKQEFEDKLEEANKAYREGNPIMTDQEYDYLLDEYESQYPNSNFRSSLKEPVKEGKEKLPHRS